MAQWCRWWHMLLSYFSWGCRNAIVEAQSPLFTWIHGQDPQPHAFCCVLPCPAVSCCVLPCLAVSCRVLPWGPTSMLLHTCLTTATSVWRQFRGLQLRLRPAAVLIQLNLSILTWDHLIHFNTVATRTVIYWHHRNLLDPAWFIDHSKFSWSGALDTCYCHWDRGLSSDLLKAGWDMWIRPKVRCGSGQPMSAPVCEELAIATGFASCKEAKNSFRLVPG